MTTKSDAFHSRVLLHEKMKEAYIQYLFRNGMDAISASDHLAEFESHEFRVVQLFKLFYMNDYNYGAGFPRISSLFEVTDDHAIGKFMMCQGGWLTSEEMRCLVDYHMFLVWRNLAIKKAAEQTDNRLTVNMW